MKTLHLRKNLKIGVLALGSMGFLLHGAWNFTGCLEFYLGLCKKVHAPAKKKQLKKMLKKYPKKFSEISAALFSFAIFVVSLKVRIKSHTSFEELLMSVLSR